jgi:PKD repeat protein
MKKFYTLLIGCLLAAMVPMQGQNALDFDGSDDYVDCGTIDLNEFTVEAWINPTSSLDGAIVSLINSSDPTLNFELKLSGRYVDLVFIVNNSSYYEFSSINPIPLNQWSHIAVTRNEPNNFSIYINGNLDKTFQYTDYKSAPGTMTIGKRANENYTNFKGKIDELRIWNSVRTQAEIAANMATELSNPTELTTLAAYYQFNQGTINGSNLSETTLIDASAASRQGTLHEFALTGSTSNWTSGLTAFVIPNPTSSTVTSVEGNISIDITSNSTWTVTSSDSWLTASAQTGTNNGTITASYASNALSMTNRSATLTFTAPGADTRTFTITQGPGIVIAPSFTLIQNSFNASNNSIVFTNTSSATGTTLTSWAWDFGDGSTSTEQNPTHTYASNGNYIVKLTASDGTNSKALEKTVTVADYILISQCETATISDAKKFYDSGNTTANYVSTENYTLVFKPATEGKYIQIDFSTINTEANYDYLYVYDGDSPSAPLLKSYTGTRTNERVIATNTSGALCLRFVSDDSFTKEGWEALVQEVAFEIGFTANVTVGIQMLEVQFTDNSTSLAQSWLWNFGDGSTSTQQNPMHTYNGTGAYDVSLTVTIDDKSQTLTKKGFIKIENELLMQTASVQVVADINFYDTGGPNQNYANFEDYILVLYPKTPGNVIQIDFATINLENGYDYMYIYNGVTTTSAPIATYTGNMENQTVTATGTSGALSIRFKSDNSANWAGWTAVIKEVSTIPTKLDETATESSIVVLPTQFTNSLTIKLPATTTGTYTLVNLTGQQIAKGQLTNSKTELALANIDPGIYLLTIEVGTNKQTFKVVKK